MYKLLVVFLCCSSISAQSVFKKTALERLGYPAGTKLLILQADDLGMSRSVDRASFAALEQHAVSSATIIVPGGSFSEVAAYAKQHPDLDFGISVTLTSDWKKKRWAPVSSDKLATLVGKDGYFWHDQKEFTNNASPAEIEKEIHAQVDRAVDAGIHPTHLDCHMGVLFTTALFGIYAKAARDYDMPFLFARTGGVSYPMVAALRQTDIIPDSVLMANPGNVTVGKPDQLKDFYVNAIKSLKPGLTEIIVHLGHDDPELRLVTDRLAPYGSVWRQREFDIVTSPAFQKLLKDNAVTVISWKDIKEHWGT